MRRLGWTVLLFVALPLMMVLFVLQLAAEGHRWGCRKMKDLIGEFARAWGWSGPWDEEGRQ